MALEMGSLKKPVVILYWVLLVLDSNDSVIEIDRKRYSGTWRVSPCHCVTVEHSPRGWERPG